MYYWEAVVVHISSCFGLELLAEVFKSMQVKVYEVPSCFEAGNWNTKFTEIERDGKSQVRACKISTVNSPLELKPAHLQLCISIF